MPHTRTRARPIVTSPDSRPYLSDAPRLGASRPPAALTPTAWSPWAQLTVADWIRQGSWLGALARGSGWWIGDWVRYGTARYGDRYGPAAKVTGYDIQSLRNMAYVAGRFDVPRRRDALSFSHHAELAGLPLEEQDLWLDRAEAGTLSVRSLRSELRQTRSRVASRTALAEARRERDGAANTTRRSHSPAAASLTLRVSPKARGTLEGALRTPDPGVVRHGHVSRCRRAGVSGMRMSFHSLPQGRASSSGAERFPRVPPSARGPGRRLNEPASDRAPFPDLAGSPCYSRYVAPFGSPDGPWTSPAPNATSAGTPVGEPWLTHGRGCSRSRIVEVTMKRSHIQDGQPGRSRVAGTPRGCWPVGARRSGNAEALACALGCAGCCRG